jgi:hypothetical protein
MSDDIDPNIKEALDNRIDWINRVTDLVVSERIEAVTKAIDEIPDEHLRSVIYVLLLARGGDAQKMHELRENWRSAPPN